MENKVNKIIKKYEKKFNALDSMYKVNPDDFKVEEISSVPDTSKLESSMDIKSQKVYDLENRIENNRRFLAELEYENSLAKDNNRDLIEKTNKKIADLNLEKESLAKSINYDEVEKDTMLYEYELSKIKRENEVYNKQKEYEEKVLENNKTLNKMVTLDSGRKVTKKEQIELQKNDLKDATIKELLKENRKIQAQIAESKEKIVELEEQLKLKPKNQIVLGKDGKLEALSIDKDEFKDKLDEFDVIENNLKKIKKDLKKLEEMEIQSNNYVEELRKSMGITEEFSNAWNEVKNEEMSDEELKEFWKDSYGKNEQENNNDVKNESKKDDKKEDLSNNKKSEWLTDEYVDELIGNIGQKQKNEDNSGFLTQEEIAKLLGLSSEDTNIKQEEDAHQSIEQEPIIENIGDENKKIVKKNNEVKKENKFNNKDKKEDSKEDNKNVKKEAKGNSESVRKKENKVFEEPILSTPIKNNTKVSIKYDGLTDTYSILNIETNHGILIQRKDLEESKNFKNIIVDKDLLAKIEENIKMADVNVINALALYDQKYDTHKLNDYLEVLDTRLLKTDERNKKMQEKNINIEYSLDGIYAIKKDTNEKLSLLERMKVFKLASIHKELGTGRVKKGFLTSIKEKIDSFISKFRKEDETKALGDGTGVPTREELAERLRVEVEPLVNEEEKDNKEKNKNKESDLEK